MNQEVTLKIIVESPPGGIDFGLQKGSGSKYETVQIQRSGSEDLEFACPVTARLDENGVPNFLGKFVQGPPGQRFIYIDIGTCAGQRDTAWSRRLKIPLTGIDVHMIRELSTDSNKVLAAKVAGRGKDNGPNCATVKPFAGWHIANQAV